MALKQEIRVVISPDGTVQMETFGIKGADCERELKSIEEALGKVKKRVRTKEYYESSIAKTKGKTKQTTK